MEWSDPFELADYQQEGESFLIENGRTFIALPVGAGKTCIPLKASRAMDVSSITVLCLGNSLWTWYRQIKQWRPDLGEPIVIEKMTPQKRIQVWNDPRIKVIIAKVGTFRQDYDKIKFSPTMMIADECQKYMRNRNSKIAQMVIEYAEVCKYAVFTTGTGVSRGRQEFFPALQALRPGRFTSYWRFVNQFCHTHRGQFGMEILGPRNTEQFRERTADTVFRPSCPVILPEIARQSLYCEMTPVQAKFYQQLSTEMWAHINGGESLLVTQNVLALCTRLRQILTCPKILDPSLPEYGGGIEAALDHMAEEDDRSHCVWFTPFVDAIPYMQERLALAGRHQTVVFQHGMDMEDLKNAEATFRAEPDCVAICSIMFSQSFELESGNPAYFIGYSFNPDDNEQAEGRLRRKTTQRSTINSYYLHNMGTYDDRVLDVLSRKTLNTRVDVRDMHAIHKILDTQNKPIGLEYTSS